MYPYRIERQNPNFKIKSTNSVNKFHKGAIKIEDQYTRYKYYIFIRK